MIKDDPYDLDHKVLIAFTRGQNAFVFCSHRQRIESRSCVRRKPSIPQTGSCAAGYSVKSSRNFHLCPNSSSAPIVCATAPRAHSIASWSIRTPLVNEKRSHLASHAALSTQKQRSGEYNSVDDILSRSAGTFHRAAGSVIPCMSASLKTPPFPPAPSPRSGCRQIGGRCRPAGRGRCG